MNTDKAIIVCKWKTTS